MDRVRRRLRISRINAGLYAVALCIVFGWILVLFEWIYMRYGTARLQRLQRLQQEARHISMHARGESPYNANDDDGDDDVSHSKQLSKDPQSHTDWRKREKIKRGRWAPGDEDAIFSKLHLQYPQINENILRERAEFGALHACSPYHIRYLCQNDESCVLNDTCVHRVEESPERFSGAFTAAFRFTEQATMRRKTLADIIDRMDQTVAEGTLRKDGNIMIMILNAGFSFLFGNWLCSLEGQQVDVEGVRKKTLVLATDSDARRYVESLGFFSPTVEELKLLSNWTAVPKISRRPAPWFGQGDHKYLNLFFKFGMPLDLLEMNFTVILQDVDFVWFRNPLPLLQKQCFEEECDGIFIAEGRPLVHGPESDDIPAEDRPWRVSSSPILELNTGLFMLRPHAQVKHFLRVLMHGVHLQQWRRRDQMFYNTLMWHQHFQHMKWSMLPPDSFVPGKRLHRVELKNRPLLPREELAVIHVSDTGNYFAKITRFKTIGHWYFTDDQCSEAVVLCREIRTCWDSVRSPNTTAR